MGRIAYQWHYIRKKNSNTVYVVFIFRKFCPNYQKVLLKQTQSIHGDTCQKNRLNPVETTSDKPVQ